MKNKHKIAMFRFISMLLIRILGAVENGSYGFIDEFKQELDDTTKFLKDYYGES